MEHAAVGSLTGRYNDHSNIVMRSTQTINGPRLMPSQLHTKSAHVAKKSV